MDELIKKKRKKDRKILDAEVRLLFFTAFRGKQKGTLDPIIRKHIDRALCALEEAGYF